MVKIKFPKYSQIPKDSRKPRKVLFLMGFLIFLLGVANIIFSCSLATSGEKLRSLDSEIQRLEKNNQDLKKKEVSLSSYAILSQRAHQLGFVKSSSVVYLEGQTSLAMR